MSNDKPDNAMPAADEAGANPATTHKGPGVAEPVTGNYFVSTYPPFFYWTEEEAAQVEPALEQAPTATPPPLGLYIHVPFCVQRCRYCYYLSYEGRGDDMEPYLGAVMRELTWWMKKPALAGRRPDFIYFGGGTPSMISTTQIARMLDWLRRLAPWDDDAELTFECAPKTLTAGKARALRAGGVNRLSLGVQQLNDDVLRHNGRIHLVEDVEAAFAMLRDAGFPQINLDLMVGMPSETRTTFMNSLEKVITMAPESITIYQTEIPYNTPLYRSIRDGWQDTTHLDWPTKHQRLDEAFLLLEDAGYRRRSAYTAVKDPEKATFAYQDLQYHGADLLGLGASSFSYLSGIHHQNIASLDKYLDAVEQEKLPVWRGHALSPEEQLIRQFVLQMKLGRVDLARLRLSYGDRVNELFLGQLAVHAQKGWLTFDMDQVQLTRDGLTRVDRFLRSYFPSHHRGPRTV